jgi:TnpA family transposase
MYGDKRATSASSTGCHSRALQEYGRLVRTRFVFGYLAHATERPALGRQQNKGESLHALHDRTFHADHCQPSA